MKLNTQKVLDQLTRSLTVEEISFIPNIVIYDDNLQAKEKEILKAQHPLRGIEDTRGCLSRYAEHTEYFTLYVTPQQATEFCEAGGGFDSTGVYGVNPYVETSSLLKGEQPDIFGGYTPKQAAKYMQAAHLGQWRNVPYKPVGVDVEGLNFSDLLALERGRIRKEAFLKEVGIDMEQYSDISLGYRSHKWISNYMERNFKFCPLHVNYMRAILEDNYNLLYSEWGRDFEVFSPYESKIKNPSLGLFLKQHSAYIQLSEEVLRRGSKVTKEVSTKMSRKRVAFTNYSYTGIKIQGVELTRRTRNMNWTSVGGVVTYTNCQELYIAGKNGSTIEVPVRKVGDLHTALISETYFVWRDDFKQHVEGRSLKAALSSLALKEKPSEYKKRFLQERVGTLAMFRELTHSCYHGTMQFLKTNAPYLARLLREAGADDFTGAKRSEVLHLPFQLTEEFVNKFSYRF